MVWVSGIGSALGVSIWRGFPMTSIYPKKIVCPHYGRSVTVLNKEHEEFVKQFGCTYCLELDKQKGDENGL